MKIMTQLLFCAALTLASGPAFAAGKYIAYIGTYTTGPGGSPGSSKGIYALQADGKGQFKNLGSQAEVADPSFLGYVPKFVLAGLLFYLGSDLVYQWLLHSSRRLLPLEYLSLIAIAALIIYSGFIAGVLIVAAEWKPVDQPDGGHRR